jgi:hypothetical protein
MEASAPLAGKAFLGIDNNTLGLTHPCRFKAGLEITDRHDAYQPLSLSIVSKIVLISSDLLSPTLQQCPVVTLLAFLANNSPGR